MVHRDQLANRDEFVTLRQQAIQRGGGHVVLPLLQAEVVPRGWLDNNTFLAGYGIAQALPGPLSIEPHRHNRLEDSQGVLYSQSSEKLARYGSSALSGAEHLTVLVGKESVALASYFSLEPKLPTAG